MIRRARLVTTVLAAALTALLNPTGAAGQTDATKVVILGTGTPIADPDRSGPAVAIVVGNESYIVDAGPGIVRRGRCRCPQRPASIAPLGI